MYGQLPKCRRNIAENFNRLTRAHERYRQLFFLTYQKKSSAIAEGPRDALSLEILSTAVYVHELDNDGIPTSDDSDDLLDFSN